MYIKGLYSATREAARRAAGDYAATRSKPINRRACEIALRISREAAYKAALRVASEAARRILDEEERERFEHDAREEARLFADEAAFEAVSWATQGVV